MIIMEEKVSKPTLGNQNWGITVSFEIVAHISF